MALRTRAGHIVAVLDLDDKYSPDKELEAQNVYKTTETKHPGVAYIKAAGPVYLGGEIHVIERAPSPYPAYHRDPAQTRALFVERGWSRVVAFQTRNPIHRAHEYITKCALETVDGLMIHPLVGATKGDDIPAEVRMRCYETLIARYYVKDRVLLSIYPAAMRYAGPREAIWHAICRKNYGCSHFIVGRDHAGVGSYYGSYDAQRLFGTFAPGSSGSSRSASRTRSTRRPWPAWRRTRRRPATNRPRSTCRERRCAKCCLAASFRRPSSRGPRSRRSSSAP